MSARADATWWGTRIFAAPPVAGGWRRGRMQRRRPEIAPRSGDRDHVRRGAGAVAAIVLVTVGALDEVRAVKVTWPEVLTVAVSLDGTVLFRADSSLLVVPDSASTATPTASTAQTVRNRARCLIGEFIAGFTLASWVRRLRTRRRRGRPLLAGMPPETSRRVRFGYAARSPRTGPGPRCSSVVRRPRRRRPPPAGSRLARRR